MNEMSRLSGLSLLLLLLIATAVLALGDNRTTAVTAVQKIGNNAQAEREDYFMGKINRRMLNTILKISKRSRLPTSNHLLGLSGSENTTHITRGNKTCLRVNCVRDHYVRSCDFDGGSDTCIPCPQGTFLIDNTSSEQYNYECVSIPECFPGAIRSLEPYYCTNHHLMYCKRDVTRNFCGVDPCKCVYGHCSYPTPVLRVNCGCEGLPMATTTEATTAKTMTTTTTVKQTTSMKSSKVVNVSSAPFQSSPPTTAEEPSLTTSRQPTIKSGSEPEHNGLSGGSIAGIVVMAVLLIVVMTGIICYVKKKGSGDNDTNSPDHENVGMLSKREDQR